MFGFLKEKLKKVFDKLKKDETAEVKEIEKRLGEEKKVIVKLGKEEKKLGDRKKEIKKELREALNDKDEKMLGSKASGIAKNHQDSSAKEEKIGQKLEKIEEKIEIIEEKKEEKKGFFEKIREKFSGNITEEEFEEFFQDLEIVLIENNLSIKVIDDLKEKMQREIIGTSLKKEDLPEKIQYLLKQRFKEILLEPFDLVEKIKEKKKGPFVIVFFGINGTGKTTTIAKVANMLKKKGLSIVLAASDTFRAASIEQLEKHAANLNLKVIKHEYGSDPAAVAFDAIAHAKARSIDVVLIDTAGRMHTKADLMKEMEKIVRVSKPDLKIFIGESIVGNDMVEQASKFNENIGIDASILTKADVDEKGGAMISIGSVTGKPIIYLGVGQTYDDLEKFNPEKMIKSIF
ncbi:MAG: signal recognition particle-docking protein FtsY [Nanoarchaeota archaeon]|nr:signal recognition particle-docking protein FtsY [Nanoarchaeota archaeon]